MMVMMVSVMMVVMVSMEKMMERAMMMVVMSVVVMMPMFDNYHRSRLRSHDWDMVRSLVDGRRNSVRIVGHFVRWSERTDNWERDRRVLYRSGGALI